MQDVRKIKGKGCLGLLFGVCCLVLGVCLIHRVFPGHLVRGDTTGIAKT